MVDVEPNLLRSWNARNHRVNLLPAPTVAYRVFLPFERVYLGLLGCVPSFSLFRFFSSLVNCASGIVDSLASS